MYGTVSRAGFVLACVLAPSAAWAETVTLGPSKDNTLYENAFGTPLSNGSGSYVFVGSTFLPPPDGDIRRAVIQFDLAGHVPAGSTIERATLTLHMSKTISDGQAVTVHRLLADWGEGASDAPGEEGGGTTPEPGDATWFHRFFDSVFWQNPGGDFSQTSSAGVEVAREGVYVWTSTTQLVADVQLWLDEPGRNFGWLLRGNESIAGTAKRFDSRENPDPTVRPRLAIEFTPPSDCDGDGTPDAVEIAQGTSEDCDRNGVPDDCELDSDGDGVIDACDACPDDARKSAPGACGCGQTESDSDGDGVPDCIDGCPDDPAKTQPGALGCGVAEDDSDGDGVPDASDLCPGADDNLDRDGDGAPDCLDGCPDDPDKSEPGMCGCGVTEADGDGDNVPDCADNCPEVFNPDQEDADADGIGDLCDTGDGEQDMSTGPDPNDGDVGSGRPPADDDNDSGETDDSEMAGIGDALPCCAAPLAPLLALPLLRLCSSFRERRRR